MRVCLGEPRFRGLVSYVGRVKERLERADISGVDNACTNCLLTGPAAQLLARLARQLRGTRGDDGSWEATTCPACGRITAITDHIEDWTFGDTGWSLDPEEQNGAAAAKTAGSAPDWVTPAEAAFLIRGSEDEVLEWLDAGRLESEAVPTSRHPFVLVRVMDVLALAGDARA